MLWSVLFFTIIPVANAATLSVAVNHSSVFISQPFRVDIGFDTQGDNANAIQGEVDFPPGQFLLQNILDGGSPISLWIQAPAETASGVVSFSGIIPGGFDTAASSVFSLWLLPTASGTGEISLNNVQVLRNDGQATPISVTMSGANITVEAIRASSTPNRPVSLTAPESFIPVISRDPDLYNGQYFLVFSTIDQASGIDHYEVMEVPTGSGSDISPSWHIATSPYLLQDQSLSSDIYVRAIDHDGNFIVVKLSAEYPASVGRKLVFDNDIVLIILCLVLILIFVVLRRLKGKSVS